MKIVSRGKVLNSSGFYEKKKKRRKIKLVVFSIIVIFLLALFIYLSRLERFLITEVIVPGEEVVDKEEIRQIAKKELKGNYLWLIPRANALFFPRGAIENNLSKEFPRLRSIELDLNSIHTLQITVLDREPFALYCAESGACFFLDEEGLIFASAPSFSGGDVYFVYTTREKIDSPLGKKILAADEFKSVSKFIRNLNTLNISSLALEVGNEDYIITMSGGGKLIWHRDADLSLVRSNLEAFLSNDSIQSQKDFLNKVESLDLRVENKVFYKFK